MATKKYFVRAGFSFRMRDDKGNEKVYSEGDTLTLEQGDGDSAHQLECSDAADRDTATKAEQVATKGKA
jgi:hypothetical protein